MARRAVLVERLRDELAADRPVRQTAEEIQLDMVKAVAPDPLAPRGLVADVSSQTAQLTWQAPAEGGDVSEYEIHRWWNEDFVPSDETRVATVTGLTYTEGCVERSSYFYRVVALDSLRARHATDIVSADITNPDCPPTVPTLRVQPFRGWAEVTADSSDERGVVGVQIHRSTSWNFEPTEETLVATVRPGQRYADYLSEDDYENNPYLYYQLLPSRGRGYRIQRQRAFTRHKRAHSPACGPCAVLAGRLRLRRGLGLDSA